MKLANWSASLAKSGLLESETLGSWIKQATDSFIPYERLKEAPDCRMACEEERFMAESVHFSREKSHNRFLCSSELGIAVITGSLLRA
jgi:hypothetical protein